MAFVKLDCDMIKSTIWFDREAREIFITALLLAEPFEVAEPMETIEVRSLNHMTFVVPPGWYGFVPAAGTGIVRLAGMQMEEGLCALERLAAPDPESRTPDHEGRRLVRVDGGYIVLNFDKHRKRDHTNAERCARYRENLKATRMSDMTTHHVNMQAEEEAECKSILNPRVGPIAVAHGNKRVQNMNDEQYFKYLQSKPEFMGLDIQKVQNKMVTWCELNGKEPTRKRLVNWLNREDKPVSKKKAEYKTAQYGE